ncbi:MAG: ABC transporter substrate-binding protein [Flavobacteriaceae bacterium]|nr:ABC transporter substrate-binding protein [Flavobacteriaceae bacterium]
MRYLKLSLLLSFIVFYQSCKQFDKTKRDIISNDSIKYAKNFSIQYFNDYKKIIIRPFSGPEERSLEFILAKDISKVPEGTDPDMIIKIPVKNIVVTSTTHIPMLELLNEENSLKGFPNLKYISSASTRKLIEAGMIRELGNDENLNTETLLDLNPQVLVSIASDVPNPVLENIAKAGIRIVPDADWLEQTPLGRAEWIRFFGALFDKDALADSIFIAIEKEYLKVRNIAKTAKEKPTILSGVMTKDIWYLPAGESYMAIFFKDAHTDYLWAETPGTGSLSLNFENVLETGQNAHYWISPGHYTSLEALQDANRHYVKFDAFTSNRVYSFATTTSPQGGVLFYELAPVQPQIVLKDLVKTVHPELLPGYEPYFLKQLK